MKNDSLRKGFTTGSCAAAAAKAACLMLLTGNNTDKISLITPKGLSYDADILDIRRTEYSVSCAVRKDGGDDPDVTTGALIYAEVRFAEPVSASCRGEGLSGGYAVRVSDEDEDTGRTSEPHIIITGGEGVGRVTRPGLDQPVGEYAINSVPRRMIAKELIEVCRLCDHSGDLMVTISVPGGSEIAEKTFNPRLGIEDGISIIGTSGVVEPMSERAIVDTIRVELSQKKAEGNTAAFISPGNYGLDFMKESYGADLDRSVKCSNFIGETIDIIVELGFDSLLLTGHAGKLVKIAGGIMNTHSRMADCRMEIIAAAAARAGADNALLISILDSLTTDEAFAVLDEKGLIRPVSEEIMKGILKHLEKRAELAAGRGSLPRIECIMYTKEHGLLAASEGAADLIRQIICHSAEC